MAAEAGRWARSVQSGPTLPPCAPQAPSASVTGNRGPRSSAFRPSAGGQAYSLLSRKTVQQQRPRNHVGCGRPRQSPAPQSRPFRSRRGGVCEAAGIRSDAATLSGPLWRWSPTRSPHLVTAGLGGARHSHARSTGLSGAGSRPAILRFQCTGASGIWAREAPPSVRQARFSTPRSSGPEGALQLGSAQSLVLGPMLVLPAGPRHGLRERGRVFTAGDHLPRVPTVLRRAHDARLRPQHLLRVPQPLLGRGGDQRIVSAVSGDFPAAAHAAQPAPGQCNPTGETAAHRAAVGARRRDGRVRETPRAPEAVLRGGPDAHLRGVRPLP